MRKLAAALANHTNGVITAVAASREAQAGAPAKSVDAAFGRRPNDECAAEDAFAAGCPVSVGYTGC
jgi:hypothetical protein